LFAPQKLITKKEGLTARPEAVPRRYSIGDGRLMTDGGKLAALSSAKQIAYHPESFMQCAISAGFRPSRGWRLRMRFSLEDAFSISAGVMPVCG
jgi:hypothetical protein